MTQPTEPRPRRVTLGPVGRALDALGGDRKARGNAKAMLFPEAAKDVREFIYAGLTIRMLSVGTEPMENGHTALRVEVEAERAGQRAYVDNPYLFVNPPILVPSKADPEEMVEDLGEAFRQMVGEAVRIVAERGR